MHSESSARIQSAERVAAEAVKALGIAGDRIQELEALINNPKVDDFLEAVKLEAAHQVERWPSNHDAGKTAADWFWLLGYLSGKALTAAVLGNTEKALHHTVSSAAVLANWFRQLSGDASAMRPGIAPPTSSDVSDETTT